MNEWYCDPNAMTIDLNKRLLQLVYEGKLSYILHIQEVYPAGKVYLLELFKNEMNFYNISYSDSSLKDLNIKINDYIDYEKNIVNNSKKFFENTFEIVSNRRDEFFTMFAISFLNKI